MAFNNQRFGNRWGGYPMAHKAKSTMQLAFEAIRNGDHNLRPGDRVFYAGREYAVVGFTHAGHPVLRQPADKPLPALTPTTSTKKGKR